MNIWIYFRAVTVADFYHRGGNGPTTAGGAMLWYIYIGRVNSSSAALCGIGIAAYVATFLVNIFHLPLSCSYFGQFGESLTNTNRTSRVFAITWTSRHLYKRGWVTWMEIIQNRRCNVWFPKNVHCSSQNKLFLLRINCIFLRSNLPIWRKRCVWRLR